MGDRRLDERRRFLSYPAWSASELTAQRSSIWSAIVLDQNWRRSALPVRAAKLIRRLCIAKPLGGG
jgi:hypothetical protein